jgi:uncharacterized membrane protein YgdD (TMEM256/DUF423 family)
MYHALAILILGVLSDRVFNSMINYAGVSFIAGIILFSGSLYLIVSLQAINKTIPTILGLATPVGGLFFMIGWLLLIIGITKR